MSFKRYIKQARDFLPSPLPQGMTEFSSWSDDIIHTYNFPDNDSIRWAMASMIMHLDATSAYKPKRYFALAVKMSISKQLAGQIFQDIKLAQQAKVEAEAKAASEPKSVEATPHETSTNAAAPIN